MSLRSGSPCTSTSSPTSSWKRMTFSISALHRLLVGEPVDLALLQLHPRLADLVRLRIGADRRRGEELRYVDASALSLLALFKGARALIMLFAEGLDPSANLDVAGPSGLAPEIPRPVICIELVGDRIAPLAHALGQCRDLTDLLDGEGHPGAKLVIEVGVAVSRLGVEVDRRVEQRAARGDNELPGPALHSIERVERMLEVIDPDVPAVDDSGEEPLLAERRRWR